MLFDRRPYYAVGLVLGVVIVAFFLFGPKPSPDQRVVRDVAILAREPWDSVRVVDIVFEGAGAHPPDVIVRGNRPNGTKTPSLSVARNGHLPVRLSRRRR